MIHSLNIPNSHQNLASSNSGSVPVTLTTSSNSSSLSNSYTNSYVNQHTIAPPIISQVPIEVVSASTPDRLQDTNCYKVPKSNNIQKPDNISKSPHQKSFSIPDSDSDIQNASVLPWRYDHVAKSLSPINSSSLKPGTSNSSGSSPSVHAPTATPETNSAMHSSEGIGDPISSKAHGSRNQSNMSDVPKKTKITEKTTAKKSKNSKPQSKPQSNKNKNGKNIKTMEKNYLEPTDPLPTSVPHLAPNITARPKSINVVSNASYVAALPSVPQLAQQMTSQQINPSQLTGISPTTCSKNSDQSNQNNQNFQHSQGSLPNQGNFQQLHRMVDQPDQQQQPNSHHSNLINPIVSNLSANEFTLNLSSSAISSKCRRKSTSNAVGVVSPLARTPSPIHHRYLLSQDHKISSSSLSHQITNNLIYTRQNSNPVASMSPPLSPKSALTKSERNEIFLTENVNDSKHQMILENQILENEVQNTQSVIHQPTTEYLTLQNHPILQISANQLNATYHKQKSTKNRFIAKQNSVPSKPSPIRQTSQTVANCTNNIDNEWEDIETHQNDDVFTEKTHQQNFLLNSAGRRKSSHSSASKNSSRQRQSMARQLENLTGATKILYQESGSIIPLSPNSSRRSLTQTFRQRSVSSDLCTSGSASLPPSRHNSGKFRPEGMHNSGRNSVNDMCINFSEDRINEERVVDIKVESVESDKNNEVVSQPTRKSDITKDNSAE